MLKVALRSLGARKLRSALTALAILLGAAMISGTYVLTDQITGAFDEIFQRANQGVDVVLSKRQAFESQQGAQAAPIPDSLIATVSGVEGVDVAEGVVQDLGALVVDGDFISSVGGAPTLVFSTPTNQRFQSNELVTGSFPDAAGEIAVDTAVADREDLQLGQRVGLATRSGVQQATLVGTFRFGDANSIGGATLTAITFADAQRWFEREGEVNAIVVAGDGQTSADVLAQRIAAAVPQDVLVETGTQNADRQAQTTNDNLGFLRNFLFVFAAIAILVGAFIIFNVFSITVAQRIREMAMLRTIGASRRQILGSVLTEAFIIALVATAIGIGLGILFAMGLNQLFEAVGFGLPTTGITVQPRTIIVPVIVGVLVTLIAALVPAIRATRISPVAVLREGATLPKSRLSHFTPYIGVVLAIVGILAIVAGFGSDAALQARLSLIGMGALLVLVGVGMAIRAVIGPIASAVGWPLQKVFGNSARLGRKNTTRDPARTGSTAAALMVGIGLVVFVAVFVDGFKSSFFDALDRTIRSDLIVISENFQPLPVGVVAATESAPGIGSALGVGFIEVEVDGKRTSLNAVEPAAAGQEVRFDWQDGGTDSLLSLLGTSGAVVEHDFAQEHDLQTGDQFTATSIDARTGTYRVLGIYKDPQLFTGFTVSQDAYSNIASTPEVGVLLASYADGTPDNAESEAAVIASLQESYPAAKVRSRTEYKEFIGEQTNLILTIFYALLAFSVLISLVGVVITLLLSIYERTREIGMMRAVGTTRGQIRAIVFNESVITCAIGGILGLGVGLFLGWVMIKGLEDEGLSFSVPVGTLIAVFIIAIIAGLLAAIFPARRAAKLQPLEALQYE